MKSEHTGRWAKMRLSIARFSGSEPSGHTRFLAGSITITFGSEFSVHIAIEAGVPSLVEARALVDRFQTMVRTKNNADLDAWITEAKTSLVASFVTGIVQDKAAVSAALTEPWSNGQVEAQITKLKLVKRQMYGRAKIDLLQARLLGAS